MPGHRLTARVLTALLPAAAAVSPLVLTRAAAASATDPSTASPPTTHAAAWGANQLEGQLGIGRTRERTIIYPTTVDAIDAGFQQVSAGDYHGVAVAADG